MKPLSKPVLLPLIGAAICLLLVGIAMKFPEVIETSYSRGWYLKLAQGLNGLMSHVPFSVFEIICIFLMTAMVALVILAVVLHIKGHRDNAHPGTIILRALTVVLFGIVVYSLFWGLNYHRQPLAVNMGYEIKEHSPDELKALCEELIHETNQLSQQVQRNKEKIMQPRGTTKEILKRAPQGYRIVDAPYQLFQNQFAPPKAVLIPQIMTSSGISGMYSPFTAEAQVNGDIPAAFLPATAMHELAHLYGFAREDEANFLAWLTCKSHPDADYRYSGSLLAQIYAMDALRQNDLRTFENLRKQYAPEVEADLKFNNAFWEAHEGPLERFHDEMNDRYLKANGQMDGTESYGRMVDLLLAVYSQNH